MFVGDRNGFLVTEKLRHEATELRQLLFEIASFQLRDSLEVLSSFFGLMAVEAQLLLVETHDLTVPLLGECRYDIRNVAFNVFEDVADFG